MANKTSLYFTDSCDAALMQIDDILAFAEQMINKYQLPKDEREGLCEQVDEIRAKQNDPWLNISVVGEFSSGKSTFINGLLGYDLLQVNSLQGTTVAITIIEYGPTMTLTAYGYKKGEQMRHQYQNFENLRADLAKLSADEKYGKKVSRLVVQLPSERLRRGFRIIDTPGTNSTELWHEKVTRRAVEREADIAVVLIDATRPLPETLVEFMADAMASSVNECAFVVNKADLLPEDEVPRMTQYVSQRAMKELGLEHAPLVVPMVAQQLANDAGPYAAINQSSLEQLSEHAAQKRLQGQSRKLLKLTHSLYVALQQSISDIKRDYEQRQADIERNLTTDLRPFIKQQIAERQQALRARLDEDLLEFRGSTKDAKPKAMDCVFKFIEVQQNIDSLKKIFTDGSLDGTIRMGGETLSKEISKNADALRDAFRQEVKVFQEAFKREYTKLKLFAPKIVVKLELSELKHEHQIADYSTVANFIKDKLAKENWSVGGGAAAGAVIGTAVCPGIGTFIGGILGGVLGAAAAPDVAKVRMDAWLKLKPVLNTYYAEVSDGTFSDLDAYAASLVENMKKEIERYLRKYQKAVDEAIAENKEQCKQIAAQLHGVMYDADILANRKEMIENQLLAL